MIWIKDCSKKIRDSWHIEGTSKNKRGKTLFGNKQSLNRPRSNKENVKMS